MLKHDYIEIKITNRNAKYYSELGEDWYFDGDVVKFDIEKIPTNSHVIIDAICEICSFESKIPYYKYNKNLNRCIDLKIYTCTKCCKIKMKKTMLDRYGVEYISQTKDNRDRMRIWMSSDEFKDKSKETMLDLYEVDHYSKSTQSKKEASERISNMTIEEKNIIQQKKENTNMIRYGHTCPLLNTEVKNKAHKTMLDKYGVLYSFQSSVIFNKYKENMLNKYGHEYTFLVPEIKEAILKIINEKYGVDNVFSNVEIKEKIKKFFIDNYGYTYSDDEFHLYRTECDRITKKFKKELKDNWSGIDFYSGENIMENFKLKSTSKYYPTIDHKVSIFNGYINGISADIIGNIDNLCYTTRSLNSQKREKNYDVFIKIFELVKIDSK